MLHQKRQDINFRIFVSACLVGRKTYWQTTHCVLGQTWHFQSIIRPWKVFVIMITSRGRLPWELKSLSADIQHQHFAKSWKVSKRHLSQVPSSVTSKQWIGWVRPHLPTGGRFCPSAFSVIFISSCSKSPSGDFYWIRVRPSSVTNSLTNSCLVDLIDVTLA